MDQASFRQFLQAPKSGSSASASHASGVLGGATPRRGYVPPPKKEKPTADPFKKPLVPHKVKKKESKYKDRAAERRGGGVADEFADAIKLQEDFERRITEGKEEGLEEKREFLGGDADHSILVKGLDMALFAREKAELEASQGTADDDELEAAFMDASSASALPELPSETKKRSREEILAVVQGKKRALSKGKSGPMLIAEPVGLNNSKFKPIGFKEGKKTSKIILGPDGQPKKLKKKKKKVAEGEAVAPPAAAVPVEIPSTSVTLAEPFASAAAAASPTTAATSTSAPLPLPPPKRMAQPMIVANNDSDDDIFAGVGEYQAFGDDSDSSDDNEGETSSTKAAPSAPTTVAGEVTIPRVNWFAGTALSRSPSPPPVIKVTTSAAVIPRSASRSRSPSPPHVMRLQGLSGSSLPSARELLERDQAKEAAAVRRQKKANWRAKNGLSKQEGGDGSDEEEIQSSWRQKEDGKDRVEKEYKQYERYEKKKEKGESKATEAEEEP